jgi:hypothetical protein
MRAVALASSHGFLALAAWILVKTCPPRAAFRCAVWFATLLHRIAAAPYARLRPQFPPRDRRGLILQWMFGVMTRHGHVDLDVRLVNGAAIERAYARAGRLILCTAHFGLTMAMFSALERRGHRFNLISTGRGHGWNWGCRQPLAIIQNDAHCLLHLRRSLDEGVIAVVYPDHLPPGNGVRPTLISPQIFRFARMTRTPLLYYDVRLEAGAIVITVVEPETADAAEFGAFIAARAGWTWQVAQVGKPLTESV